ncbi:MAG: Stp1/IreP family PP2C-type Ser/Thr phosphatase [Pseudomonadota bacterium]
MRAAHKTHAGMKRRINEDSVHVDRRTGLFIVADGLGGHQAGRTASSMAVQEIAASVAGGISYETSPPQLLMMAILRAHTAILRRSSLERRFRDMGTTVVVALIDGDRIWTAHVGDSRAYLIVNGTMRKLTHDHTFVADLLRSGKITAEEARTSDARHGLYMAVGVDDDIEPVVAGHGWEPGVGMLLCSDGLTEMLEDDEILGTIHRSRDLDDACTNLINAANDRGGTDNISVILLYK